MAHGSHNHDIFTPIPRPGQDHRGRALSGHVFTDPQKFDSNLTNLAPPHSGSKFVLTCKS